MKFDYTFNSLESRFKCSKNAILIVSNFGKSPYRRSGGIPPPTPSPPPPPRSVASLPRMLGHRSSPPIVETNRHLWKYVPGYVIDRAGPVSYTVEVVVDGRPLHWKRHIDQLHVRFPPSNTPPDGNRAIADIDDVIAESDISDVEDENVNRDDIAIAENDDVNADVSGRKTYPRRERRAPDYYGFS